MSDIKHCTVKSVGRNTRTYKQFIHQFAVIRPYATQSNGSHPSSWSWLSLSHYIYQPLRGPCAEKADFFPQKLDSMSDPTIPPSTLFLPFPSLCLSAVKGNNRAPNRRSFINAGCGKEKQKDAKKRKSSSVWLRIQLRCKNAQKCSACTAHIQCTQSLHSHSSTCTHSAQSQKQVARLPLQ